MLAVADFCSGAGDFLLQVNVGEKPEWGFLRQTFCGRCSCAVAFYCERLVQPVLQLVGPERTNGLEFFEVDNIAVAVLRFMAVGRVIV